MHTCANFNTLVHPALPRLQLACADAADEGGGGFCRMPATCAQVRSSKLSRWGGSLALTVGAQAIANGAAQYVAQGGSCCHCTVSARYLQLFSYVIGFF
jgi:hypothetical protein